MKLSLDRTAGGVSYDEESNIFQALKLRVVLPDASTTVELNVTSGDTVSIIKKRLEVEHGVSYKETVLMLNGRVMLEPLSLNDFTDLPPVAPTVLCKAVPKKNA